MTAVILMFAAGVVIAAFDCLKARTEITSGLVRNVYGQGEKEERLRAQIEGQSEEMNVTISERAYTKQEIKEVFDSAIRRMDALILGENKSLDRIEADMNLITEIPGESIDVSWELGQYDAMNVYGKLKEEGLKGSGTMTELRAVLTYREEPEWQAVYECTVMIYPKTLSKKERLFQRLADAVAEADEKSKASSVLVLPGEIEGKEVHFYPVFDTKGIVLMIMALIIWLLLYALERQNRAKKLERERLQMQLDYPEIVSKLTLFLGAGMTVKRAWKKIVEDYTAKEYRGERRAYEEMRYTCREMESGVMESESYERFGKRCKAQEYVRLGALLSQNLRKGTKGLNDLLKLEAAQMFEERKARAKKLGEEAGTKLLVPMFLMLAETLVIIVVPAFLSIQL